MQIEEIMDQIRCFIRERFGVPDTDEEFSDDVDLFNFGYIDSLGAAELTSFTEKQFQIKFTDADWVNFPLSSIREISTFVLNRRNEVK
jgi:methoxymalonate biosynthesis acyl carrier protein